jgi:hypothetical protein
MQNGSDGTQRSSEHITQAFDTEGHQLEPLTDTQRLRVDAGCKSCTDEVVGKATNQEHSSCMETDSHSQGGEAVVDA